MANKEITESNIDEVTLFIILILGETISFLMEITWQPNPTSKPLT